MVVAAPPFWEQGDEQGDRWKVPRSGKCELCFATLLCLHFSV